MKREFLGLVTEKSEVVKSLTASFLSSWLGEMLSHLVKQSVLVVGNECIEGTCVEPLVFEVCRLH